MNLKIKFNYDWSIRVNYSKQITCRILALSSSAGIGNSIFLSSLPDRIKAGSNISALFVAAITFNSYLNLLNLEI